MISTRRWLCLVPALFWAPGVYADYKSDIGYDNLENVLVFSKPTGANIGVVQVEASSVGGSDSANPVYAPDITNSQFAGKTFIFPGAASTSPSGHATGVGSRFYGNDSIAYGISNITSYETNAWLNSIASETVSAPFDGSRIVNHSWVGNGDKPIAAGAILRLVDRQVELKEAIQVVGMANSAGNSPLLGSAFNVIAVGRNDGGHDTGSDAVDPVYLAGRTRPDVVVPQATTSVAAPVVSAAAALLIETGHDGASALSNDSIDVNDVGRIYNAERAETIKAALMAGADRITANTSTTANITDYRSSGHQTGNGLDNRFGAGQINILHSYQIITAGEQDSSEDSSGGRGGWIDLNGFDYDASFGGSAGSNSVATYKFNADAELILSASLVWNLGVANNSGLTTTLHDLNLELYDATTQTTTALSAGTIDNTENLWVSLVMGHSYELLVKSGETGKFSWDYALTWHMSPIKTSPVPVPGAFYLFASAIAGLGLVGRRKA